MNLMKMGWDILLRFTSAGAMALAGSRQSWTILLILMGLDLITALIAGKTKKQPVENGGVWGFLLSLLRKATILAVVLLARLLDQSAGSDHYLENGAMGFYLCHEGIILLKNAAVMGIPVPMALRRSLKGLEEKNHETL